VTAISRGPDKLDVFVVGTDGHVYAAGWQPDFTDGWHGWLRIGDITLPQAAPVTAVSRGQDKLNIFATDVNGEIWFAGWEPSFSDGWHGWFKLKGGRAKPGAPVTTVSRGPDKLDVFVTGTDGHVYTLGWQPDGWRDWSRIGDITLPQGAPVHAVSRGLDKLNIFAADVNGDIWFAGWEPSFSDGWHGWFKLKGGSVTPGAPVTAVSRGQDKLDVFVVGRDGRIWTAKWEPAFTDGWHGWWAIGD
jgi:hypothetical protein